MNRVLELLKSLRKSYAGYGFLPLIAFIASSAFVALQARQILFKITSQKYSDLVVGIITAENVNKGPDYYAPMVFWLVVTLLCAAHYFLSKYLDRSGNILPEINRIYIYPISLLLLVLGTQLMTTQTITSIVAIAYLSPLLTLLITAILCFYRSSVTTQTIRHLNAKIWITVVMIFFATLAISTALARANHSLLLLTASYSKYISLGCIAAFTIALVIMLVKAGNSGGFNRFISKYIAIIQIPVPLLLLVLIPKPWSIGDQVFEGYKTSAALHLFLWAIIAIGVIYCIKAVFKASETKNGIGLLSPWAVAAIMIFILTPLVEPTVLNGDDYHFGEVNLPWHQLYNYGKLPWIDLSPTVGLANVYSGFVKWLFFNDTLMAYAQTLTILNAIYAGALFFAALEVLGMPAAILITAATGSLHEFVPAAILLLLSKKLLHEKVVWVGLWLLMAAFLVTFHLSSGLSFFLGSLPVFFWMLYQAYRQDSKSTVRLLVASFAALLLLVFLTPLGEMLQGIIFFVRQHADINTTTGAKIWKRSDKNVFRDGLFGSDLLFETFRFGWIMLLPVIAYAAIAAAGIKSQLAKKRIILFSIIIAGYLIVNMKYALGRIDTGTTRTGGSTFLALMFYVPAIAFLYYSKQKYRMWLIPALLLISSASMTMRKIPLPDPLSLLKNTHAATQIKPAEMVVNGHDVGFPCIGTAVVEPNHLNELLELKQILSRYLQPGDTYLDVTNRTARYIYMNYPVPTFDAATYTTPSKGMQQKMISAIIEKQPALIVIGFNRIDHDGSSMSLRSSLIYRYLMLNYVPVNDGSFVLMVHPSRIADNNPIQLQERLKLLDTIFTPAHLGGIPASWGNSWEHLAPLFTTVARLENSDILSINSLVLDNSGSFSFTDTAGASIIYSVHNKNIIGRNAGYALVSYGCDNSSSRDSVDPQDNGIQVSWLEKGLPLNMSNTLELLAPDGKLLIPLESNPRWLLSNGIETLIFSFPYNDSCKKFTFKDVQLLRRSDVLN